MRTLYEDAEALCETSCCPACYREVAPAVELPDGVVLCPCCNCGYVLTALDLGGGNHALLAPSESEWKRLLAQHGRTIASLKRSINLDRGSVHVYSEPDIDDDRGCEPRCWQDWAIVVGLVAMYFACYGGLIYLAALAAGKL